MKPILSVLKRAYEGLSRETWYRRYKQAVPNGNRTKFDDSVKRLLQQGHIREDPVYAYSYVVTKKPWPTQDTERICMNQYTVKALRALPCYQAIPRTTHIAGVARSKAKKAQLCEYLSKIPSCDFKSKNGPLKDKDQLEYLHNMIKKTKFWGDIVTKAELLLQLNKKDCRRLVKQLMSEGYVKEVRTLEPHNAHFAYIESKQEVKEVKDEVNDSGAETESDDEMKVRSDEMKVRLKKVKKVKRVPKKVPKKVVEVKKAVKVVKPKKCNEAKYEVIDLSELVEEEDEEVDITTMEEAPKSLAELKIDVEEDGPTVNTDKPWLLDHPWALVMPQEMHDRASDKLDNDLLGNGPLKSLNPDQWVSDEVVERYAKWLNSIYQSQGYFMTDSRVFTTQYLMLADQETRKRKMKRYLSRQKLDFTVTHTLLIPLHLHNNHWALVVLDFEAKYITYYDTIPSSRKGSSREIAPYLLTFLQQQGFDVNVWRFRTAKKGVPVQKNGYDCGPLMLFIAKHVMGNHADHMNFTEDQAVLIRFRIFLEITRAKLVLG